MRKNSTVNGVRLDDWIAELATIANNEPFSVKEHTVSVIWAEWTVDVYCKGKILCKIIVMKILVSF